MYNVATPEIKTYLDTLKDKYPNEYTQFAIQFYEYFSSSLQSKCIEMLKILKNSSLITQTEYETLEDHISKCKAAHLNKFWDNHIQNLASNIMGSNSASQSSPEAPTSPASEPKGEGDAETPKETTDAS